ncbi:MAG: hypothetical protein [Microviridae sp.]|nr:MAG: hypothetical protein [Microviridae sp.]
MAGYPPSVQAAAQVQGQAVQAGPHRACSAFLAFWLFTLWHLPYFPPWQSGGVLCGGVPALTRALSHSWPCPLRAARSQYRLARVQACTLRRA